jgi:outer membrane protein assembly factor BamB
VCHDFEGNEIWRKRLPLLLSAGQYGTGTSPIIVGRIVVLSRDQFRDSTLLALDLATGAIRWETPRPETGGSFGSPAFWRNQGVDEIVVGASARLKGYDLRTGVERWAIEGITGLVCTTPVTAGDRLIFGGFSNAVADSAVPPWEEFRKTYDKDGDGVVAMEELPADRRDYLRGVDANRDGKFTAEDWEIRKARNVRATNLLIAVKPGGTGDISDSHVAWQYRQGLPYVPSPLFYAGRIYFVRDGGLMTSLDPQTGEPFYAQERLGAAGSYYASPVAADGRIYVASLPGKLSVVKAGGAMPEVLHTSDFGERILATPAIIGKNLYLRTQTKLYAFEQ